MCSPLSKCPSCKIFAGFNFSQQSILCPLLHTLYCLLILAACTLRVIAEWMIGRMNGRVGAFRSMAGIAFCSARHPLPIKFLVFKWIWDVFPSFGLLVKVCLLHLDIRRYFVYA